MIEVIAKTMLNEIGKLNSNKSAFDRVSKLNLNSKSPFVNKIETRNKSLEGSNHLETGVKFNREKIKTGIFKSTEGVFPEFESQFDAQLPKDLYKEADNKQFKECNNQLKNAIETNNELKSSFSEEQLKQIEIGRSPRGYTWHHNEKSGLMQLVDSDIHAKTGHTGGKAVWGGGTENR